MRSRGLRSLPVGLIAVLVLSACGGDGGQDDADDVDPTVSPTETTTETTEPEDDLTEAGTELSLGETATIQWSPSQRLEGHIALTVTRLDQVSIKVFKAFKLDEDEEASTPYYVHVGVENLGTTDLSGVRLPLYLNDGSEVLIPQVNIPSAFEPCPSQPLPEKFTAGKEAELCLVYLAPEGRTLDAIALRPEELAAAITWTGEITKPAKPKKDKGKGKGQNN